MDVQNFLNKIRTDRIFYIENYLKIKTKDGQLAPFKLNRAQRRSLQQMIDKQVKKGKPIRVIWLKARQLGISTFSEGLIFHDTVNNPFRNAMIIAHEDKATQNLFAMSKLFYEELPQALRPMKKYSNEQALVFENPTNDEQQKYINPGLRSKITVATAKNVDTGRSATTHALHASEVAFWQNAEVLMTGLLQTVPDTPNTMVFIESTANGVGGWFYDFWNRSERGETDYIPIFLAWFVNPEYSRPFDSKAEKQQFIDEISKTLVDEGGKIIKTEELILREREHLTWEQLNWRKWTINNKLNGDVELFRQEYPSTPDEAFIVSGRPRFNVQSLRKYQQFLTPPIARGYLKENESGKVEFVSDESGYLSIWKMPQPNVFYTIGSDVAEGLVTGDYSCGIILDENLDIPAMWHGHIDPDLLGYELVKLAKFYNDGYIGVEANNHGLVTLKAILRKEYWNVFYQKNYDKINDQVTQKLGWRTTKRTKPMMIDSLAEYIREGWLGIKSELMISELFTYVIADDGTTNAQTGCHDDTVISLAIALQLFLEGRGVEYAPEIPKDQQKPDYFDLKSEGDYGTEEVCIDNSESEEYSY